MILKHAILAGTVMLSAAGAHAEGRNLVVQLDGSCMGMNLHVTNDRYITGTTFGCSEAGRSFVGKMQPGHVADVTATGFAGALVNYRLDLDRHDWEVFETIDGKRENIGNGFLTQPSVHAPPQHIVAAK